MSFGKQLRDLSSDATGSVAREVWDSIKESLKDFAKKTGEKGLNVFFMEYLTLLFLN